MLTCAPMAVPVHSATRTCALVRVEETLVASHAVTGSLYLAMHTPGVGGRLGRLGAFAATLPALGALALRDKHRARRLAALHARGLGVDRVELLAAEFYERYLAGRLREQGLEVIERARKAGHSVVLVSAGLECALRPLVERVGADALVGSELELQGGVATGKLLEPWRGDRLDRYAQEHGINLHGSYGYGVDGADLPLLRAVGFPCAVNPDRKLRRVAEAERWPILTVRQ